MKSKDFCGSLPYSSDIFPGSGTWSTPQKMVRYSEFWNSFHINWSRNCILIKSLRDLYAHSNLPNSRRPSLILYRKGNRSRKVKPQPEDHGQLMPEVGLHRTQMFFLLYLLTIHECVLYLCSVSCPCVRSHCTVQWLE